MSAGARDAEDEAPTEPGEPLEDACSFIFIYYVVLKKVPAMGCAGDGARLCKGFTGVVHGNSLI